MDYDYYVVALLAGAAMCLFLGQQVLRLRRAPGAYALAVAIFAAAFWSLTYALELNSQSESWSLFWAKVEYLAIPLIPASWFVFVIQFTRQDNWFPRRRLALLLLAIIPLATAGLVWTNEWHRLHWSEVRWQPELQQYVFAYGPGFWLLVGATYSLLFVSLVRLVRFLPGSAGLYRQQTLLTILAMSLPWLGNFLYVWEEVPLQQLDVTPLVFTVSSAILTLNLYRLRWLQMVPVAHQQLIAHLAEGIFVLDEQNRIVDLNPAAQQIVASAPRTVTGAQLDAVAAPLASQLSLLSQAGKKTGTIALSSNGEERHYALRAIPLYNSRHELTSRLLILNDISELIAAQQELEREQSLLEQEVQRRTEALGQANECLAHELGERERMQAAIWRLADQRTRLFEVSQAMVSTFALDEVVRRLLRALDKVLRFDMCTLYWRQDEPAGLRAWEIFARDAERERLVARFIPDGQGLAGAVARSGRGELVNEAQSDGRTYYPGPETSRYRQHAITLPIRFREQVIAVFQVVRLGENPFSDDEYELVQLFITQANIAIHNALLYTELEAKAGEIRGEQERVRGLAARLGEVSDREKQQLARELHDRFGQSLTALNLNLAIIERLLPADPDPALLQRLADSVGLVEETARHIRDVMADLRPPVLDDYGLVAALRWYGEKFEQRTGIAVTVSGDPLLPRLPQEVEIAVFRIMQEALNNTARYARAGEITMQVAPQGEQVAVTIADDGVGFDLEQVLANEEREHWGVLTMQERAAAVGAELAIDSAPGGGTCVTILVGRQG
jgi:PAS domain S-box-containing protein